MPATSSSLADQILDRGYGTVHLGDRAAERLEELYRQATRFFAQDTTDKLRYSVPNRISGYRPFKYANTGSVDKPDLNDSFLYWKHRRAAMPYQDEIARFLDAAEAYREVAGEVVSSVIDGLRAHYGYPRELTFEQASVLQINSFVKKVDSELYQFSHEDADLLTVIWGSAPGLEAVFSVEGGDEKVVPFEFDRDEVLIMPGSLLTAMTGGEVPPFYHQVRNHNIPQRKSIMYFVCPDATNTIEPFLVNDFNRELDIQRLVIENPQLHFGLSEDFVSS